MASAEGRRELSCAQSTFEEHHLRQLYDWLVKMFRDRERGVGVGVGVGDLHVRALVC